MLQTYNVKTQITTANYGVLINLFNKLCICPVDYSLITTCAKADVLIVTLFSRNIILCKNINLYCLSFEALFKWNNYLELRLQRGFLLQDFMQFEQEKLALFIYDLMSCGLL